jgi:hypothetical protein
MGDLATQVHSLERVGVLRIVVLSFFGQAYEGLAPSDGISNFSFLSPQSAKYKAS